MKKLKFTKKFTFRIWDRKNTKCATIDPTLGAIFTVMNKGFNTTTFNKNVDF